MTSKAIFQDGYNKENPLSTLKMITRDIPRAGLKQVVVRVTVRPINPTDFISVRNCLVNGNGTGVIGSEGCGVVHEVGEGVTEVQKGQRVATVTGLEVFKGNGSFQEYILLDEHLVWPVPDGMSDEVASQFVINPWTAYAMVKELLVPKGEYLIQTAAASTIGRQIISLAHHWGIKTINIVRRQNQIEELKALGADEVIVATQPEEVVARVKEITGGKLAAGALDALSGSMTGALASCVRNKGRVFVYGMLEGTTLSVSALDLWRDVQLRGWIIYNDVMPDKEKSRAVAKEVMPLLDSGVLQVAKCERWAFEDWRKAMEKSETVGGANKLLLVSQ